MGWKERTGERKAGIRKWWWSQKVEKVEGGGKGECGAKGGRRKKGSMEKENRRKWVERKVIEE